MSSKKKDSEEKKILWGRPGNSLKMGIVGLPNVGKSTTFNLLSKQSVPAENFPFCTIDPSSARVAVPDKRFDWLVEQWKPPSAVSAMLEIHDIAGLVKGASTGEGLGNAFLSHIRAVDGIYHVIRLFEDVDVTHVEGAVDPIRDLEIINNELRLKDVEFAKKFLEQFRKLSQQDKQKRNLLPTVEKVYKMLKEGESVRECTDWKVNDIEVINQMQLLTVKPVIYLVNMSERDFLRQRNKNLPLVKEWIKKNGNHIMVPYSAVVEAKLEAMDDAERKAYLTTNKTRQMLGRIILSGYKGLDLIHYFTAGEKEVKCWTVRALTKAPQAAGVIHGDFEKGFICAEVMSFDAYKEHGSEAACKKAGLYRQQGKEYIVQDGDIMFFKCNTAGLTKAKKK
mmetsp:Transcript_188/g.395  ORF Transcript_188/g.395 Transcript_188/m.395 type:complete len:394 (+) Transcript_188:37-1218(+)